MARSFFQTLALLRLVLILLSVGAVQGERRLVTPFSVERVKRALAGLDVLFPGRVASAEETKAQADQAHIDVYGTTGDGAASVYGEIQPAAVVEMFKLTAARPGQRYYDLGSGFGKSVVFAWLLGLNATGVELATDRWAASCGTLQRVRSLSSNASTARRADTPDVLPPASGGIRFVRSNFLDFDFSDADLVFTNSVMFSDETMEGIAKVARRLLRPGAKVVSSHRGLPGPGFQQIGTLRGPVSWSHRDSFWTIQEVVARRDVAASRDAPAMASRVDSRAARAVAAESCEL